MHLLKSGHLVYFGLKLVLSIYLTRYAYDFKIDHLATTPGAR